MTLAQFRTRYQQFADTTAYPDDLMDMVLQEASRQINDDFFGDVADDAHGYLSAHIATNSINDGAASGAVASGISSVTAGSASISYASVSAAAASALSELDSTAFGKAYNRIVHRHGGIRAVV
jgi:hypothetical protein